MLILAGLLLLLGVLLFWQSLRQRKASGLPGGRVIYTDTRTWGEVEKPLFDSSLGLTGKPDYLVEQGGKIIPVEVKTGRIPNAPHDSHIYQLAAYCLLVQRELGNRPPYGLLHYRDRSGESRTYAVDYTSELEGSLLAVMEEMRADGRRKEVHRSHEEVARCKRCGYRDHCVERLQP